MLVQKTYRRMELGKGSMRKVGGYRDAPHIKGGWWWWVLRRLVEEGLTVIAGWAGSLVGRWREKRDTS